MLASWLNIVNYELVRGNQLWRFVLILLGIMITMAAGKIVQFILARYTEIQKGKKPHSVPAVFLESISKPLYVAVFALGLKLCKTALVFQGPNNDIGFSGDISAGWDVAVKIILAFAVAYALNKLVDVVELYLGGAVAKTATTLDDMLVPVLRKSLRVTIALVAALFVLDMIVGLENIKSLLVGAGVGGIAIALAAKDTIANLFGSLTIFAVRPFQIKDLVQIEGCKGSVEEVGLRSTKIRTLEGNLVILPNEKVVNSAVENFGKRPSIRRTSNITITYDSGAEKAELAVNIIKEILSAVPEINCDSGSPPQAFFDEFNDCSLNIYMTYWVKPPDWWLFQEVNQRVNLEMMRRFRQAGIEFAFPTQTLYLKKDDATA